MHWRPYGRDAVLITFADKPDAFALQKRLRLLRILSENRMPRIAEFVPGFTNVLIEFDRSADEPLGVLAQSVIDLLTLPARDKVRPGPIHEITVAYDGPDLRRVAEGNGITIEKVIKFHTDPIYHVQLLGFSPGFPYLGELHHKLRTPRLPSPRLRIAAGSVAIGGEHTGVYTVESAGGWNLIGRTEVKLFDLSRARSGFEEEAFKLRPGDRVKFVAS